MFNSFLPKGAPFFKLLLEQSDILCKTANALVEFIAQETSEDNALHKISELEAKADKIQIKIITHLSHTFITPIDREDIIRISQSQEESVDLLRNVANRIFITELPTARFPMHQLANILVKMVLLTRTMLQGLERKKDSHKTSEFLVLRDECEMLLSTGLTELYDVEDINPLILLNIIKYSQIYDRIEVATNHVVELAEVIEEAVLKNV